MFLTSTHPRESERLALLRRCEVLDRASEEEFERLAALAAAVVGAPVALVNFIDQDRQWCKAWHGCAVAQVSRAGALCAQAILDSDRALVIEDARRDPRFSAHAWVTGSPNVVFYAGVPLRVGAERLPLGTLCVIDHAPRILSDAVLQHLHTIARQVEILLEQRLRQSELVDARSEWQDAVERDSLLAKVAAQVPGMVYQFVLRPDGSAHFPYCSAGIQGVYGFSPEQVAVSAQPVIDRLHADDQAMVLASIVTSARTLTLWVCEYRYCHPDGRTIWLQGRAAPELYADGSVLWHGFITDITERKQNQAITEREQARFRIMVDGAIGYGIFMLDAQGVVQSWNPGAQAIKGYRAEEIIGRNFSTFYPPEIRASCPQRLAEAVRVGRYEEIGWRLRKDGSRFWAITTITPILTGDGTLVGFTKITRDISDRLQAEKTSALLKALVDSANYSIITTDPEGIITTFNAAAERALGYRAAEVIGVATSAIIHDPDEVAARAQELSRELGTLIEPGFRVFAYKPEHGIPEELEWTYIRKNGGRFPVRLSTSAIRDSTGTLIGYLGIASDITARKQADAEIRTLQDLLQDAIESLDAGFVMYDADERLVLCNRRYRELYHIPPEVLLPGTRYEEVIRRSMSANPEYFRPLLVGEQGLESFIAKRMHAFRTLQSSPQQKLQDRWIQINEQRTVAGGYISLRTDITDLKNLEAVLQHKTEVMEMATTTAGIGVWIFDVASGHLHWDERMHLMYGYTPDARQGTYVDWLDRLHPDDRERAQSELHESLTQGTVFRTTFRLQLPDGTVRHMSASAGVSRDASGKVIKMIGVNLDITEHIVREQRLQQALRAQEESAREAIAAGKLADAASRAKAEFLATMSHEIRTPMNGVIGMTSLLMSTKLTSEQRDYLNAVRVSGDALLILINDILDFSKIDAGKLDIEPIRFDLRNSVEDVIDLLGAKAAEKGVDLLLDYPASVVNRVVGDEGRIRQILLNLLGNALKFTAHGAVVVMVEERAHGESPAHMRITVSDSGIGMSQEQLARLFQPFSQADASTSRRYGGTGLGLAICARLAALMHGTITATSAPGEGSSFVFEIPLVIDASATEASTGTHSLAIHRQPGGGILVRTLTSWGLAVIEASSPAIAARVAVRAGSPQLVLIDQRTAAGAAELLASLGLSANHIPILVVANGTYGEAERMAAAGFRAYLAHPLRWGILRQALNSALANHGRSGGVVTRHSIPDEHMAEGEQPAPGPQRKWRVLLAEDNTINQMLARRLLERLGCEVNTASNGAEAVDFAIRHPYDLILMDCQMPLMDGFEATRAIRASAGPCREVPIIAVTANAMQDDKNACLSAGMNDHLAKPITLKSLEMSIQRWLGTQL